MTEPTTAAAVEAVSATETDPAIEAISNALKAHNCRVDGFLVVNESICKGVPEIKPLPQVGESEADLQKRAEVCKADVDAAMEKYAKAWRVTAAVLNGPTRIQIDIVDKPAAEAGAAEAGAAEAGAAEEESAKAPKADQKQKKS